MTQTSAEVAGFLSPRPSSHSRSPAVEQCLVDPFTFDDATTVSSSPESDSPKLALPTCPRQPPPSVNLFLESLTFFFFS